MSQIRILISKKFLRQFFQCSYNHLHNKVMTDDVIKAIGMTRENYEKKKTFSYAQSQLIINHFQITKEEIKDSGYYG